MEGGERNGVRDGKDGWKERRGRKITVKGIHRQRNKGRKEGRKKHVFH